MDVSSDLSKAVGKSILVPAARLEAYVNDKSAFTGKMPLAVVRPRRASDVAKVMRFCNSRRIKVVAHGGGSSLTGASIPVERGIVIDLSGLKRILEVHLEDRYVVAEPGVTIAELNKRLARHGYFYPPDPASASFATVGGTIGTNAGGLRAVMYGSTKDWVLGLEVVLPDGRTVQTGGRVSKRSIGYDLTSLIVGSEGTLGIVTKAVLRIWPRPPAWRMFAAYYNSMERAVRAVGEMKEKGILIESAEFIDSEAMALMAKYKRIKFPERARYVIFVEVASGRSSVDEELKKAIHLASSNDAIAVKVAEGEKEASRLYEARRFLLLASEDKAQKSGRKVMIADIVVPLSQLHAVLPRMRAAADHSGLGVVIYGHIGDGNMHADISYDPKNSRETRSMNSLQEAFGSIAIEHGGSVSGEHGIGVEKKRLLREEFAARRSLENIELMRKIKKQFDPNGILNPGKIFD